MKKQRQTTSDTDSKTKPQAEVLINLLTGKGVLLFSDQYKDPYISLDGTTEQTFLLGSNAFKHWLANFAYVELGKPLGTHTQGMVIQILSGKAMYETSTRTLELRAVFQNSGRILWYDLGNNIAAEIDAKGWSALEKPPVIFRRLSHQKPHVLPDITAVKEDILLMFDFLNIKQPRDELLFLVYLVAAFIPDFPHPLLILHGPQGAGKTTPFMMLKQLIDPSQISSISAPKNPDEFVHIASGHYFFYFDNLSHLPQWLSDSLARIVTGDGFSKRKLFSDMDDVVRTFRRTVGLNGINQVITQPDLLDRAILIGLERISDENRIEHKAFWDNFDETKPRLLGAIFQIIADAMAVHDSIKLDRLPRMADFLHWGCAIAVAMGYTQEDFVDAYYANINRQNDEAVEASSVARAVIEFMSDQEEWQGTPDELFELLVGDDKPLNPRSPGVPKASNWLVRNLNALQPTLASQGITYERLETARPRQIRFITYKNTVDTDISSVFGPVEAINDPKTPFDNDDTSAKTVNKGSSDG